MAAKEQDNEEELDPIEVLTLKVKKQQKVMLIWGAATAVGIIISLVTTFLLSFSQHDQVNDNTESLASAISDMEEQLTLSRDQSIKALTDLNELSYQVASLDVNDEQHAIVKLQKILIRQERDYRNFLGNLENGMYAMHLMIPHSRSWWDQYQGEIEQTSKLSKARENYIINLRNN